QLSRAMPSPQTPHITQPKENPLQGLDGHPVSAPTPERGTVCGLAPPSSLIETSPVTDPATVGLKVTVMVEDSPPPTPEPQVLVWENSLEPVTMMLVMLRKVLPTFVRVVVNTLLLPTVTEPKFRLVGLSSTTVPVPVRFTVCGLPGALSLIETLPVRVPDWVGLNVTLIAQLAPGATELPQVFV